VSEKGPEGTGLWNHDEHGAEEEGEASCKA
jgi:hypothetical protein